MYVTRTQSLQRTPKTKVYTVSLRMGDLTVAMVALLRVKCYLRSRLLILMQNKINANDSHIASQQPIGTMNLACVVSEMNQNGEKCIFDNVYNQSSTYEWSEAQVQLIESIVEKRFITYSARIMFT